MPGDYYDTDKLQLSYFPRTNQGGGKPMRMVCQEVLEHPQDFPGSKLWICDFVRLFKAQHERFLQQHMLPQFQSRYAYFIVRKKYLHALTSESEKSSL